MLTLEHTPKLSDAFSLMLTQRTAPRPRSTCTRAEDFARSGLPKSTSAALALTQLFNKTHFSLCFSRKCGAEVSRVARDTGVLVLPEVAD